MSPNLRQAVHRDAGRAVLIGPLKAIVPIITAFILFPVVISKSGIEVLGLWSLISTAISYITVADVGFSQLLMREIHRDDPPGILSSHYADYVAAQRAYLLILIASLLAFSAVAQQVANAVGAVYSAEGLIFSIVLIIFGGMLQVFGKLDAAVLSANQDNSYAQLVANLTPLFMFSATIVGAFLLRPIEGFAIGTVLTGLAMVTSYRWRLRRQHPRWMAARVSISWLEAASRTYRLFRRGVYLYSIPVGFILREPLLRFVIVAGLGLEAVAIYTIAARVSAAARQIVADGFIVLYPSLAALHRAGDRIGMVKLLYLSLMLLAALGTATLGLLFGLADIVITLWLGELPENVLWATRILLVWNLITLFNVPFFHLLQATGQEKTVSLALWAHTIMVFPLWFFVRSFNFAILDILIYWTVTSIVTQLLIYYAVESRLSLFWVVILRPRVILVLVSGLAFFASVIIVVLSNPTPSQEIWEQVLRTAQKLGPPLGVFVVVMVIALWRPVFEFVAENRHILTKAANPP